ncbi:MAG: cytochrome-c peroxidase [Cystobacterineae bacterium]|nr:cytochrome-c peroxidase [Cystobacterineae bacterium]
MRKTLFLVALSIPLLFACKDDKPIAEEEDKPIVEEKDKPIVEEKEKPIVEAAALAPFRTSSIDAFIQAGAAIPNDLIDLGRMLFYEQRLSKADDISCNTCHDLANLYGAENEDVSTGHNDQRGGRNAPTVYNAAMQFVQFWDGRAQDVEAQAVGPITNPIEMAMDDDAAVVEKLGNIPGYVTLFESVFSGDANPISMENIGKAIGAFERRLITPAPFHRFLAGDSKALTEDEQNGLKTFLDVGCASCHDGPGVGGIRYRKLGAKAPWPGLTDKGRGDVTGNTSDDYSFKVSSLLNVAQTAPYGHNGQRATLEEAVEQMAQYQLGKTLSAAETSSIVTFLNALTGEIPEDYIQAPTLP